MTKTEIENKIYDLKRVIESCENIIKANEKEIKKLESEKEKTAFERVGENKEYHTVSFSTGKAFVISSIDTHNSLIAKLCFENNNYFLTKERAREVASKINFLLKIERMHDAFCPDYKPDWSNTSEEKWYVTFDYEEKMYVPSLACVVDCKVTYFNGREIAEKVCDVLNKEIEK